MMIFILFDIKKDSPFAAFSQLASLYTPLQSSSNFFSIVVSLISVSDEFLGRIFLEVLS